jgi:phosphate transport system substrate-binding protein
VGSSGRRRLDDVRTSTLRIVATVVLGTITGCGGGGGGTGAALKTTPTIVVDGSSTVVRISEAAQAGFKSIDPTVLITVDEHGTGGGFANYLKNEVDVVDASREAKPDEERKAQEQGIPWTRFVVGYDGITVVINAENDFAKELSVDQLKATWAPGSKVKTWKDIDPSWPNNPIGLYSPDNDSGTFDYFTEAIVGKPKSQRDDVQQNSSDNSLVQGVAGDKYAMGYFGYPYYSSNKDKLRAVAIRNGKDAKAILPSPETIRDKTYVPLSRPLFIYVKNSSARRSEVGRFVRYYLENIEELAKEGGYEPPSAQDKAANKEALDHLLGGEAQASAASKK